MGCRQLRRLGIKCLMENSAAEARRVMLDGFGGLDFN